MTEKVCIDLDGVSAWYYDPATHTYSRLNPEGGFDSAFDGKLLAHLHGQDIPNPDTLWMNRCKAAGVNTTSMEGLQFKPTPTVYSLFMHWQGVKNA